MLFPTRNEIPAMVDMEDGLLVYSESHGSILSLNGSARLIWLLCDGSHTVQDICRELGRELGLAEAELLPDIELGLKQLEESGLIAMKESDPAADH